MGFRDKVELQTRKMITSYGGVGSIVESIVGALIIEPIEQWRYFHKDQHRLPENQIDDERLLRRLRYHFPNLKALVKVPVNVRQRQGKVSTLADADALVTARYFPKWMYCKRCKNFKHIDEWWEKWKNALHGDLFNEYIRERFIPPRCYICYSKAKSQGKRQKYYDLEQVRFVMTSPSGDIRDIPWDWWNSATYDSEKILLEDGCSCGDSRQLQYFTSTKFTDLAGITVKCSTCGESNTLSGIFNLRIKHPKEDCFFKPVIRASNSVYYSQTISGVYLPVKSMEISSRDKFKIKSFHEKGLDTETICIALEDKYSKEQIEKLLSENYEGSQYQTEMEFRQNEFNFLLQNDTFKDDNNYLLFEHVSVGSLQDTLNSIVKVKRLRVVTFQTSYTRQEPLDKDAYLQKEERTEIKRRYTSNKGRNTDYLTGVESFGEGIFVNLKSAKVRDWYALNQSNHNFSNRIKSIQESHKNREFGTNPKRFNSTVFTAKFILVHTLAHLLIKEFEFLVGYPAASLSERLYVDESEMQAVLIYAVAGSEGSYGGLISQCTTKKINQILKSALIRARDCASDPVCYYSDGQGIANLNLAACYSCALLPETSCEEFNSYLDRRLLIDEEFGYFEGIGI